VIQKKRFKFVQNSFKVILLISILIYMIFIVSSTYLNENSGWQQELIPVQWASLAWGDVDNNNLSDLIIIGCNSTTGGSTCDNYITKFYINNGTSLKVSNQWGWNLTSVHYGSVSWGDIDNDGDLDLALIGCSNGGGTLATCNSAEAFIYINNGTSLVSSSSWKGNVNNSWKGAIAFGDINNDGRLDLALTGENTAGNKMTKIYINNGSALLENEGWEANLAQTSQSSISLGDINNDGKLDLVLTGRDSDIVDHSDIYINNGTSLIEDTTWDGNLLDIDMGSSTLGDYDNDGDLDFTLIGIGDYHRIYRNNGTSLNQIQAESGGNQDLVGIFHGALAFGDYDNSGYLGLLTTGEEKYTTLYLYNSTSNLFSPYPEDPENHLFDTEYGPATAWNDIDNDGDLDTILIGWDNGLNWFNAKVYINNRSLTQNNSLPYNSNSFENYTLTNGNVFFGWGNASDNETTSLGLYYNLRVGTTSGGNEIVSGVFGGSSGGGGGGGGANGYFGNMMQHRNITLLGSRFETNTTYYWSVQTIDTGLAKSAWSPELTFTTSNDFTPPTITLNAPRDNFVTNQSSIIFNSAVYDDQGIANVTLYGNWSNWHANETNSSGINNTNYIFVKNLTEGNHLWTIRSCDNTSNCIFASNYTFRIDQTLPEINLISPSNSSSWTTSSSVAFIFNVSDIAINNCSLLLNNAVDSTDSSITVNTNQTITSTLSNGNYNWTIRCTDAGNNINISSSFKLTVSYTAPENPSSSGSSGGSSGGGGTSTTNKISRLIPKITEGNNIILFLEAETNKVDVEEIQIDSNAKVNNVKVTVEKLDEKPEKVSSAGNNIYSYLKIDKTQLTDENINEAKIKFRVNKTWMKKNNLQKDKIILKRFTSSWTKLPTELYNESNDFYFYEAETPGFSVFAITAENIVSEQNKNKEEENISSTNLQEQLEQQEKNKEPREGGLMNIVVLAVLILGILISVFIIIIKKKSSKK